MSRWFVVLFLSFTLAAQQPRPVPQNPSAEAKSEHRITPAEAEELFKSVDEIMKFVSEDTGMPIRAEVKRKLVSRDEVEKMLKKHMEEDEDTKRFERSELILKKFGMLPKEFELRPLLISLLKEQVAGFYDPKEKTINLLDWLPADKQKAVLAHELTHALQDQQVDLEKWMKAPNDLDQKDEFNKGIRSDEASFARSAVTEGQGMITLTDYLLAPIGTKLSKIPAGKIDAMKMQMTQSSEGEVLKTAPVVVRESLIFPYRDGLGFVFALLKQRGQQAAFTALLKNPPVNSHQVLAPAAFISQEQPPDPMMPDLKKALGGKYEKFDSGAVGEFDLQMLFKQFGVENGNVIASHWRGGMYYAGKRSEAQPRDPADIALFYVSYWDDSESAERFRTAYESFLPKRYPAAKKVGDRWNTVAGDVRVLQNKNVVIVMEGFESKTAAALETIAVAPERETKVALDHGEIGLGLARWSALYLHPAGIH